MEKVLQLFRIPIFYLRPTFKKGLFVAAVHNRWLFHVTSKCEVPEKFTLHDLFTPEEVQAFLWDSDSILGPDWSFIYIDVIENIVDHVLVPSVNLEMGLGSKDLSYSQFLHYISQTNYKNMWKEAQKKYPEGYQYPRLKSKGNFRTTDSVEMTRSLLMRIFDCPLVIQESSQIYTKKSPCPHRVLNAKIIFEQTCNFFIIFDFMPHDVHQCLSLSPALFSQNNTKALFLLFQFLHAVKDIQDRSLFIEGVLWHHVFMNETLSVKVLPSVTSSLIPLCQSSQRRKEGNLQELTVSWVRGCLSNFDYLVALNDFAGRQMNNPFNHPVLPWVSDLSSPFGNWRDLSKSKFRLNKGDRQLDLTFDPTTFETADGKEEGSGISSQVPHHVTDVLSEITYYVYQARRTARSILCRYVRPHWNPLEYPSTIERMQQWTPDECIPQFFSDPSIFKSIHEDLPDLGFPSWATSAEDFVNKHRNALESPYVSERLHHWIDLTFGYRLTGSAAVKSKNIHLSLVDQHQHLSRRGVVQLFCQPHPKRLLPSPYAGRSPPRLPPVQCLDVDNQLPLPLDYNPVGLLHQLETVSQLYGQESEATRWRGDRTHQVAIRRQRDLQWLATLALELFLPMKFRPLPIGATLEDRLQVCQHVIKHELSDVPRCLRTFLKIVLQNETITAHGLPPPSPHQLLQPMVSLLAFPSEFPLVDSISTQLSNLVNSTTNADFVAVGKMLSNLNQMSSVILVVPFVKELLQTNCTALRTALYLFDPIAAALGPHEAAKEFLAALLKLMAPDQPVTDLALFYHKRFLLMLQVRLGLRCFLNNFSLLLVEAVGGCYDFDSSSGGGSSEPLQVVDSTADEMKSGKDTVICVLNPADAESEPEAGVFTFDNEEVGVEQPSEESGRISGTPSRNSSKLSLTAASGFTGRDIHQLDGCYVSQISADSLLWQALRLGPVLTARFLTRNLLRMLTLCYVDENSLKALDAEQAKEFTMFQVSGHLIQGDFNASRILSCLSSVAGCYGEQFILLQYLPHAAELASRSCNGNISLLSEGGLIACCSLILASIPYLQDSSIMFCLGETLLSQLLKPITSAVVSTSQVFSRGGSARSALAIKLLDCLCALTLRLGVETAAQLVAELAIPLLKCFDLIPNMNQEPNPTTNRTSSAGNRPEYMTHQRRLSSTLRRTQNSDNFQELAREPYCSQSTPTVQSLAEMAATFSDQFAFQLLSALNSILGVNQAQQLIDQHGKTAQRCAAQWVAKKNETADSYVQERRPSAYLGLRMNRSSSSDIDTGASSYGSRVSVVGNRIQLYEDEESATDGHESRPIIEDSEDLLCYKKTDNTRHLRGNWLAYWEHESGRHDRDTRFNFKQIRLLQLIGHSAGIRTMHVMDSECGLLTAGRDKTARVWNLQSQGDGNSTLSACYVYTQHRKPLLGVNFIEATRLAASCDGAVHLWDPFVGTCVRQLDATSSRFPTVTAMKSLPPPCPSLVVATAEGTLRLLDSRSPLAYQNELKISPVAAGLVRCLTAGSNGYWVAAGHSSGILSLIDLRTGMLLSSWKGHEGEVLQVNAWTSPTGSHNLISSSLDQSISVWSADDGKHKFNLRGSSEPVHCLSTCIGELVTATTANRIGVHTSLSANASYSSIKLRSDTFKGVVTSMALFPLNRMMVLGSDTGVVSLFC